MAKEKPYFTTTDSFNISVFSVQSHKLAFSTEKAARAPQLHSPSPLPLTWTLPPAGSSSWDRSALWLGPTAVGQGPLWGLLGVPEGCWGLTDLLCCTGAAAASRISLHGFCSTGLGSGCADVIAAIKTHNRELK